MAAAEPPPGRGARGARPARLAERRALCKFPANGRGCDERGMKAPSRAKRFGRGRGARDGGSDARNPFEAFEDADETDETEDADEARAARDPDPPLTRTAPPAPSAVLAKASPTRARARARGNAETGSKPRHRLRRVVLLTLLFLVFMPAAPVLIYRFLPPPASAMMVKRWFDAQAEGRPFDLNYHWVPRDRIARSMRAAVVASEDQRFYVHRGFDWKELRNAVDDWRDGDGLRGASTISQQVAKNLFLWPGRSFLRKGFEAWFTLWIEWVWPKRRILEVYLNVAELGDGVFGVEAASRRYFKHGAAKLVPHEAALLAAMLPSPLRSNPANPSAYLRQRQRWILRQL